MNNKYQVQEFAKELQTRLDYAAREASNIDYSTPPNRPVPDPTPLGPLSTKGITTKAPATKNVMLEKDPVRKKMMLVKSETARPRYLNGDE